MIYNIRKYPEKQSKLSLVDILGIGLARLNQDLAEVVQVLYAKGLKETVFEMASLEDLVRQFNNDLDSFKRDLRRKNQNSVYLLSTHQKFELDFKKAQKNLNIIQNFKQEKSIDYKVIAEIAKKGIERFEAILDEVNIIGSKYYKIDLYFK